MRKYFILVIIILTMILPSGAWYGNTHKYIVKESIKMLPPETMVKINLTQAAYGSIIPDCNTGPYCIGDQSKHLVYYHSNGSLQNDIGTIRSKEEYNLAKFYLQKNDIYNFSLRVGAMGHYIGDLSQYGHTMGNGTSWGLEKHHVDYEQYAEQHPNLWNLSFDGKFKRISAYDAALKMAKDTTFDNGLYTNVWMDKNYNWSDPNFVLRTKDLINYNVNILADVIYTMADTDPPSSITKLENKKYGKTYIHWVWKDPEIIDFEKVMIYINGKFKTNVSKRIQHYYANNLMSGTIYEISTHTVDANGNINKTRINNTGMTRDSDEN